jgi:hypothetical protein
MFNADMPSCEQIPPLHKEALDDALTLLQKRTGTRFPEGSNPHITSLRLTIDPTFICWRPITFYVIIGLINRWLRHTYVNQFGATLERHENLEYLLRVPKGWNCAQGPRPLVFLHGLGLGLLQYHILISELFWVFTDRPILIPLQPQISQDFFHPRFLVPVTRHQMVDNLARVLDKLGWVHLDVKTDESDENYEIDDGREAVKDVPHREKRGVTMFSHSK